MIDVKFLMRRFTIGGYPINGYLVACPLTHIGVFIDPGGYRDEIDVFVKEYGIDLRHIFFTHGHWDHVEGLPEFKKRYSVQCCAGADEVKAASRIVHGGEILEVGKLKFEVLSIPGHSPSHVVYYCHDSVFTGDCIYSGSVGGCYGEDNARMQSSHIRSSLFSLPDRTLIFPAHGPMTTVAAEKYGNPFLQKEDVFRLKR